MDDVGQSFKKASMDETPYFVRLKATSHLSAAAEATAQCRRIVDVFNLFQNRASIKVRPTVLVFDAERSVTVNHYTEQLLASQPNRAALRLTRATLTETDMEPHLGLQNALEQHSIALATDDPKAGLVGIWTAIECLTGDERRGSPDIGRIRQRIGPIVALRRVERIVRYLASCCHGHYRSQRTQPTEGFRRSTINYLSPRDIFEALTGPRCNPEIMGLLADVADNPLLRYRLYRAWETFNDPLKVRKGLCASYDNVTWQLERIYRARNLTVHSGRTPRHASLLVDHAQEYFARCVSRVLADLKLHDECTVPISLEEQSQRFWYVVEALKNSPKDVPAKFFFPRGDEFSDYRPWSAAAGNAS